MADYPPSQALARPPAVQLRERPHKLRKYKKPSKMFMPQRMGYEEDRLRKEFFKDHPWELARPTILMENDGRDGQRWDWSKEYEVGRPVNGEAVVQRQHALMTESAANPTPLSRAAAYDKARKEMYQRRAFDEMEVKIAQEEAMSVDAEFGMSLLDVGMQLENKEFNRFRSWAQEQVTLQEQARAASYAALGEEVSETKKATLKDGVDQLADDDLESDAVQDDVGDVNNASDSTQGDR
ncbi:MAG: hypothetical protein Q9162_005630 [Coniocarpon cinnabarinum]